MRVYVYNSIGSTEGVERQVSAVREGLLDEGWASIADFGTDVLRTSVPN